MNDSIVQQTSENNNLQSTEINNKTGMCNNQRPKRVGIIGYGHLGYILN